MRLLKGLTVACALLVGSQAAIASEFDTGPTTALYLTKSFGGTQKTTESLFYGLRINHQNTVDTFQQNSTRFTQPALIDLRFSSLAFDGVYLNGVDIIQTHKAIKASGLAGGKALIAATTAVVAAVALAAANESSNSNSTNASSGGGDDGDGGDGGDGGGDDGGGACIPGTPLCSPL